MKEKTSAFHIGERLKTAAKYASVRFDGEAKMPLVCADIGCDHGYLALYLAKRRMCDSVFACDINEKPLSTASENVGAAEKDGKIPKGCVSVEMHDGLSGLSGRGINRVIICGMGGEVIANIIETGPEFHTDSVVFVLQPMSRETELRAWLLSSGFSIIDETLVRDAGRIYTVMLVRVCHEKKDYSLSELYLGRRNIEKGGELLAELCMRKLLHAHNLLLGDEVNGGYSEENAALFLQLYSVAEKSGAYPEKKYAELYDRIISRSITK